jgi:hypothetical protein
MEDAGPILGDDYDRLCALLSRQLEFATYSDRPLTANEAQSILALVQAKRAMESGQ